MSEVEKSMIYSLLRYKDSFKNEKWFRINIDYFNEKATQVLREIGKERMWEESENFDDINKRLLLLMIDTMEVNLDYEEPILILHDYEWAAQKTNLPLDQVKHRLELLKESETLENLMAPQV